MGIDEILKRAALVATVVGGGYYAFLLYQQVRHNRLTDFASNQNNLKTDAAASIIPSNDPTSPGFSNYARRADILMPLDIADQPLGYGQAIPT